MENLTNYLIWYNCYEDIYYAIERDSYLVFFNGSRKEAKYHQSKSLNTLVDIVSNTHILNQLTDGK